MEMLKRVLCTVVDVAEPGQGVCGRPRPCSTCDVVTGESHPGGVTVTVPRPSYWRGSDRYRRARSVNQPTASELASDPRLMSVSGLSGKELLDRAPRFFQGVSYGYGRDGSDVVPGREQGRR